MTTSVSCAVLATLATYAAAAFYYDEYDRPASRCSKVFESARGGRNGQFSSPGPAGGARDRPLHCRFTFVGRPDEKVQLAFQDFRLDAGRPVDDPDETNCDTADRVKVSTLIGSRSHEIAIYCRDDAPPQLMSSGNVLELDVHMQHEGSSRFRGAYSFVTNFGIETGEQRFNESLPCTFEYHASKSLNGTLYSPNYPGLYPRNIECQYVFYGKSNQHVRMEFLDFVVEGISPACSDSTQSDYIVLSNFANIQDKKMDPLCGPELDEKYRIIYSDSSYFRLNFVANSVYDAKGFKASYEFQQIQDQHGNSGNAGQTGDSSAAAAAADVAPPAALLLLLVVPSFLRG